MSKLNSSPALGSSVSRKAVDKVLKAPQQAILNADDTTTTATLNKVLSALRQLQLINPEMVVNGAFDADVSSWAGGVNAANGSLTWNNGAAEVHETAGLGLFSAQQAITTEVGKTYKFGGDIVSTTGSAWLLKSDSPTDYAPGRVDATPGGGGTITPGSFSNTFTATAAVSYFHLLVNAGVGAVFDNISLTEA